MSRPTVSEVAEELSAFYDQPFGGKPRGRFRVSPKMLRKIAKRQKLSDQYIRDLADELFELGFVLLDMETFYAVAGVRTFASYRRLGEGSFEGVHGKTLKETLQ